MGITDEMFAGVVVSIAATMCGLVLFCLMFLSPPSGPKPCKDDIKFNPKTGVSTLVKCKP